MLRFVILSFLALAIAGCSDDARDEPRFDLTGTWTIPGDVECRGPSFLPPEDLKAMEVHGNGAGLFRVEQTGRDLDVEVHNTLTGESRRYEGTISGNQVRYQAIDARFRGVPVTVMGDGTVLSDTHGGVTETTEGAFDGQAATVTCTAMLERIGDLT